MNRLTQTMKVKQYPIKMQSQKGMCLYCSKPFTDYFTPEFDHLNNNTKDNRPENLALVCHSCNNRKKSNAEMQVIGSEQLKSNLNLECMCAGMLADTGTSPDLTSSQATNKTNMDETKRFLYEHTINNQIIILKDCVNAITYLCQEKNGTGSQSAIYRYIESLTNKINGKYTICLNDSGKNIIRKRSEN